MFEFKPLTRLVHFLAPNVRLAPISVVPEIRAWFLQRPLLGRFYRLIDAHKRLVPVVKANNAEESFLDWASLARIMQLGCLPWPNSL